MKYFGLWVLDCALNDLNELIAAYELQKASSSWVNADALDHLFPKDARVFHMTSGGLDMDGGLKDCERVTQVLSVDACAATGEDYLLLDSGLPTVPEGFPGFIDQTNHWFWKWVLTNKAVFRWVSDSRMLDWNPAYAFYTKAELLAVIDDTDRYEQLKEKLGWKQEGDTVFLKAPTASRGEGNQEVPYLKNKVDFRREVENFDSDEILVEQAKGCCVNEGCAEEGGQFKTARLGIFYQRESGVKVVEMRHMTHDTFDSHAAKKARVDEVRPLENLAPVQTFFENMNDWNILYQVDALMQNATASAAQHDLCRKTLHLYLKHFYDQYRIGPGDEKLTEDTELQALLDYLVTYLENTGNHIVAMSKRDDAPLAYARSFVKMLSVLACHLQHRPVVDLLCEQYGSLQAIQNQVMPADPTIYYDLEFLMRPTEPDAPPPLDADSHWGYESP